MESSPLQFHQPLWMLAGLLVCVGIVVLYARFDRRRDADLAKLVHPRFRRKLMDGFSPVIRRTKRIVWLLAVFLLFTTLARPQMGFEFREVNRRGIDILFALDASRSMLAEDLTPNRLDRARLGILDFIARLEGDRIGLVPFAGSAYALCPLTLDYDAFRDSLNMMSTDMIQHQGTDLASAIKEAERLFAENQNNQKILVLITDGEDLQGDVLDAAKSAAKNGMVIYTVGVGSQGGASIPIQYRNGQRDFVRDSSGQVVRTSLDESMLKRIAETTKGLYVPLGRGAEGLNTIYQEKLRLVPKSDLNQRLERIPLERYQWPLGAALLLLLAEFFLPDRRREKRPAALRHSTAAVLPLVATLLLAHVEPCRAAQDSRVIYNQGTAAYQNGDFVAAAELLRDSLKTADTAIQQRSYYNLGNALYRNGQASKDKDPKGTIKHWEQAIKAYDDALSLEETDADARFNKDLVERKLKELQDQQQQEPQQDQDKKDQDDEKKDDEKKEEDKKDSPQDSPKDQDQDKGKDGEKEQDPKSGQDQKGKDEQQGKENDKGKADQPGKDGDKGEEGKDKAEGNAEQKGEAAEGEGRQQKIEMTAEEAKQLLDSLRSEERFVMPVPQQQRNGKIENSTRGKTW